MSLSVFMIAIIYTLCIIVSTFSKTRALNVVAFWAAVITGIALVCLTVYLSASFGPTVQLIISAVIICDFVMHLVGKRTLRDK